MNRPSKPKPSPLAITIHESGITTSAYRAEDNAERRNARLAAHRHRRRRGAAAGTSAAGTTAGTAASTALPQQMLPNASSASTAQHLLPRRSTHAVRMARPGYRWSQFTKQARQRGLVVGIRRHEHAALVNQPCIYCGGRPSAARRSGASALTGSIASADMSYGTAFQHAPRPCNYMKNATDLEPFLRQVRRIAKQYPSGSYGALAPSPRDQPTTPLRAPRNTATRIPPSQAP